MRNSTPKQLYLGLADELIVDNFAGGGGASLGIEMAVRRPVDIAVNHDREAVAMHMANHPQTRHYCEDVWDVDPVKATGGRPVGLAWFSPDCTFHSKARGGKPFRDRNKARRRRGLAWLVIKWAKLVKPRVIMLENVEEFAMWGPLLEDGTPDPLRKGFTFRRWKRQLENHGYRVEERELRACDHGAPTIRKRLFVIARCDGQPIVWPTPTHGAGLKPYRTAAECIDWSIPCPSIFERERPLAEATMRRIAKGVFRYVIDAKEPFIVTNTTGNPPRSVRSPLKTVTTGNHHYLLSPFLTEHANASNQRNMPADEPLRTQCAEIKGGHFALVAPTLIQTGYGERPTRWRCSDFGFTYDRADRPVCGCSKCGSEQDPIEVKGQAPRVPGLDKPLGTVVGCGQKHALVSAFLTKFRANSVGSQMDGPVHTITAGSFIKRPAGAGHAMGVVAVHMAQHNGGMVGHDVREPVSTITQKGSQQQLVAAHLINLKGGDRRMSAADGPAPTVTAGGYHIGEVRAFLVKYYGTDQDPQLREPLHTVTTKDRFGLVTVKGEDYIIADIGMRMLQPRELYRAQGFPDTYIIDPVVDGKPLTKTAQVRMVGNSVSPSIARALVEANLMQKAEPVKVSA